MYFLPGCGSLVFRIRFCVFLALPLSLAVELYKCKGRRLYCGNLDFLDGFPVDYTLIMYQRGNSEKKFLLN